MKWHALKMVLTAGGIVSDCRVRHFNESRWLSKVGVVVEKLKVAFVMMY